MLEAWVRREFPQGHEASWFELSAAASTDLTIFALLALASEPTCSDSEITQTRRAYFPWTSTLAAMLDSYVDQAEDAANGDHSYIAHYPTPELATHNVCLIVRRCLREARALKNGEKHILIVSQHGRHVPVQGQRPDPGNARRAQNASSMPADHSPAPCFQFCGYGGSPTPSAPHDSHVSHKSHNKENSCQS